MKVCLCVCAFIYIYTYMCISFKFPYALYVYHLFIIDTLGCIIYITYTCVHSITCRWWNVIFRDLEIAHDLHHQAVGRHEHLIGQPSTVSTHQDVCMRILSDVTCRTAGAPTLTHVAHSDDAVIREAALERIYYSIKRSVSPLPISATAISVALLDNHNLLVAALCMNHGLTNARQIRPLELAPFRFLPQRPPRCGELACGPLSKAALRVVLSVTGSAECCCML